MNKIGILSTAKDDNWQRRLRWCLATSGKFFGLRMGLGTLYDFLSQILSRLFSQPVHGGRMMTSGLRHWQLEGSLEATEPMMRGMDCRVRSF